MTLGALANCVIFCRFLAFSWLATKRAIFKDSEDTFSISRNLNHYKIGQIFSEVFPYFLKISSMRVIQGLLKVLLFCLPKPGVGGGAICPPFHSRLRRPWPPIWWVGWAIPILIGSYQAIVRQILMTSNLKVLALSADLLSSIFSWICIKHSVAFYQNLDNMSFETEDFNVLLEDC